jgi:hypothetical protein
VGRSGRGSGTGSGWYPRDKLEPRGLGAMRGSEPLRNIRGVGEPADDDVGERSRDSGGLWNLRGARIGLPGSLVEDGGVGGTRGGS